MTNKKWLKKRTVANLSNYKVKKSNAHKIIEEVMATILRRTKRHRESQGSLAHGRQNDWKANKRTTAKNMTLLKDDHINTDSQ